MSSPQLQNGDQAKFNQIFKGQRGPFCHLGYRGIGS